LSLDEGTFTLIIWTVIPNLDRFGTSAYVRTGYRVSR
jgi:hypothetical protein